MLSYAEYEPRLWASAARHHLPIAGTLELTYRCNFACGHCFLRNARAQSELDTAAWLRVVDEIADAGGLWLTLSGGEAMAHAGFAAIYEHALRRGLLLTVFSNGSTLTPTMIDLFRHLPPRTIEVTLYGASAASYEKTTGDARHFAQAMGGVTDALAAGLDVHLKAMVLQEMVADLPALRELAARLGRPFRYDTLVHAALGAGPQPRVHRLTPAEVVAIEQRDDATRAALVARQGRPESAPSDEVYRCGAGRTAFTIAPDGFLQPCALVRSLRLDLAQMPFADAWAALRRGVMRRYSTPERPCRGCTLRFLCGTCPGIAEVETGDPEGVAAEVCATAHARASALLGQPPAPSSSRCTEADERLRLVS